MTPAELAERRRALGLSQTDLAHRLGVSRVTLNRWERGTTKQQPPRWLDAALWAIEHGYEETR